MKFVLSLWDLKIILAAVMYHVKSEPVMTDATWDLLMECVDESDIPEFVPYTAQWVYHKDLQPIVELMSTVVYDDIQKLEKKDTAQHHPYISIIAHKFDIPHVCDDCAIHHKNCIDYIYK